MILRGVKELWMVAVNENNKVICLEKKKNPWTTYELEFTIANGHINDDLPAKNNALSIIKRFKINRFIEYSLLIGSVMLLVILIVKRRKTLKQ